ncbi:uncharacterized protein LOC123557251 [Mercenaria mercenaria]|uniref:uncharacterized protein LOC123557251 n=1 Tax=Mercenaria mercenaria TaxID=6596 RepID=UPI00234F9E97|nr:uncharacterized protein LOC123557251 [Mercenaria mercenaria]XP_045204553.2 uncharacterized protein LOC123557251 [Mercenaria mercenaria]XP_045204554.2 uncharacterized protein LOC123557251 [Mercenaria mercenaria]XP_045204555.2 uncharacterized protein LOC123557251 [Mercenaria mercenaria]
MAAVTAISPNISGCVKVELANITARGNFGSIQPVLEKYETGLLLLLGFAGISVILALLHRLVRKHVYNDANNVDTAFDAGGRVSTSLTAVTVASQFLWPGDILQSSTITVKSGISGPLWYTVGAALNIALFPIVSVYLKTRAPGAKTYLQIMKARYGKPAHVIFVILALLVNLCVVSTLIVAGVATFQSYTVDASNEFCVMIIAVLFGSYSFIGGLGTTFYVSYFNAVLIFGILIALNVKILYSPDSDSGVGSIDKIYEKMQCLIAPEGNAERSYFTFKSENGLVWAFMGLCVTASLTYCDQAAWQSRIAAKPLQGVLGFLIAAYIWFAIPISISTSAGLAYLSMALDNSSTSVLSPADVDEGLITPFMTERLLGDVGGVLIVTMIAMTLMSTGSGEVMAVSSIIVYDIYQVYINPFRKSHNPEDCILCNKKLAEPKQEDQTVICTCPNVLTCQECKTDEEINSKEGLTYIGQYRCQYHGRYRQYQERMLMYKSWCILWVTIAIVPLGLAVIASGVDLNWVMMNGFIVTLPCFPPVVLSIFWSKTSRAGVISGALFGIVCGVSVALGVASTYEGGLNNFLENTVQNNSVMAGAGTSIGVSFLVTLLVSCGTHNIKSESDVKREWLKLRDIDNPLHPWSQLYVEDIPGLQKGDKPSVEQLDKVFKKARILAYVGGAFTAVLFVGIVPAVMLSLHVLTMREFEVWTHVLQIFCFSMAAVVVVVAPAEEIIQICRQRKENKKEKRRSYLNSYTNDMHLGPK